MGRSLLRTAALLACLSALALAIPALAQADTPVAFADGVPSEVPVTTGDSAGNWNGQSATAASGDTIVVGNTSDLSRGFGNVRTGAAYVYVRDAGTWVLQARLEPPDGQSYGYFGTAVAIDGDTIAVGAQFTGTVDPQPAARVYVYTRSGSTWTLQQELASVTSTTTMEFGSGEGFGKAVALSGDTLMVGAPFATIGTARPTGAVYVYERTADVWQQTQRLAASGVDTPQSWPFFGSAVALDGGSAVVGSPFEWVKSIDCWSGYVYFFAHTDAGWILEDKVTETQPTPTAEYGSAVSLDGDLCVVGAPGDLNKTGAAYVLEHSGASWLQRKRLTPADCGGDNFGTAVCVSAGRVVVGDPTHGADTRGAAFLFAAPSGAWEQMAMFEREGVDAGHSLGFNVAISGGDILGQVGSETQASPNMLRLFAPYVTDEGMTLNVPASEGVLVNDTHAVGTTLTATLVSPASHGAVTLAADGSFSYTPDAGFNGDDAFTYTASDGVTESAATTVSLVVRRDDTIVTSVSGVPTQWVTKAVSVKLTGGVDVVPAVGLAMAPVFGQAGDISTVYRRDLLTARWNKYSTAILISRQGISKYFYRSYDRFGNAERIRTFAVRIDSGAPVVTAYSAHVFSGHTVALPVKVKDVAGITQTIEIKIIDSHGTVRKVLTEQGKPSNKVCSVTYRCQLPRGTYTIKVRATNAARTPSAHAATARLTVY